MKFIYTRFFISAAILIFSLSIYAQGDGHIHSEKCGTEMYMKELMQNDKFRKAYLEKKEEIRRQLLTKSYMPCATPLIVPVAIHYNTPISSANTSCLVDAANAQIDQMNLDFASCNANVSDWCDFLDVCPSYFSDPNGGDVMPEDGVCIQFCIGDQNLPAGEDNIGGLAITEGNYNWPNVPGSTWDDFLNIFVSNTSSAGLPSGVLGVAPLSSGSNPNGNGVWVVHTAFGAATFNGCTSGGSLGTSSQFGNGATLTHEVGHYFGLEHTFSDALADTPPQSNPNTGCPTLDTNNCTTSVGNDHCFNFMDYVNDDCMSTFSADQATVMVAVTASQTNWATNSISCFNDWTMAPIHIRLVKVNVELLTHQLHLLPLPITVL